MDSNSVFRSLLEVFPQVDVRILKAVAIEHSEDADAAFEFVLEVLPSISESSESSAGLHDTREMEHPSDEAGVNKVVVSWEHQGVEEVSSSLFSASQPVEYGSLFSVCDTYLSHVKSPDMGETLIQGSDSGYLGDPKEPRSLVLTHEVEELNTMVLSQAKSAEFEVDLISNCRSDAFQFNNLISTKDDGSLFEFHGRDRLISTAEPLDICQVKSTYPSCLQSTEAQNVPMNANAEELFVSDGKETLSVISNNGQNSSSLVILTDLMDNEALIQKFDSSVSEHEEQLAQCSNVPKINEDLHVLETNGTVSTAFTSVLDTSSFIGEKHLDLVNIGVEVQKDLTGSNNEYEEQSECLPENNSGALPFKSEVVSIDSNFSSTVATRSGHLVSIDFLEDFIADAKSSKKLLVSAKESVTDMIKEVELLEERTIQAKEEASTAGQDILIKVEELKQMLKLAKETNDMRTGEVYGEKAILATEARELQFRLLNLSNERDRSLSIIDEISHTLGERLAAAKEELAAAEMEKLKNEELARKALYEQEIIMDGIVEESKKLQQGAEENSKLREFLMDRGRIVDMLQGEIAVICEDVLLLKARVDGRLPLGRSLPSTSSTLASSLNSSYHNSSTLLDTDLHPVEIGESCKVVNTSNHNSQQLKGMSCDHDLIYAGHNDQLEGTSNPNGLFTFDKDYKKTGISNPGEVIYVSDGEKLDCFVDLKEEIYVCEKPKLPSDDDWILFDG